MSFKIIHRSFSVTVTDQLGDDDRKLLERLFGLAQEVIDMARDRSGTSSVTSSQEDYGDLGY